MIGWVPISSSKYLCRTQAARRYSMLVTVYFMDIYHSCYYLNILFIANLFIFLCMYTYVQGKILLNFDPAYYSTLHTANSSCVPLPVILPGPKYVLEVGLRCVDPLGRASAVLVMVYVPPVAGTSKEPRYVRMYSTALFIIDIYYAIYSMCILICNVCVHFYSQQPLISANVRMPASELEDRY